MSNRRSIGETRAVEAVKRVLDLIESTGSDYVSVYAVAAAIRGDALGVDTPGDAAGGEDWIAETNRRSLESVLRLKAEAEAEHAAGGPAPTPAAHDLEFIVEEYGMEEARNYSCTVVVRDRASGLQGFGEGKSQLQAKAEALSALNARLAGVGVSGQTDAVDTTEEGR